MPKNIPPISREDIRAVLETLNSNRKRKDSPFFSIDDELVEIIRDALEEYRDLNETEGFFSGRKDRMERLKNILATGKAFSNALKASKRHDDLTIFRHDIQTNLELSMGDIIRSAKYVFNLETEYEKRPGHPPKVKRTVFIARMFNAYKKATGKLPGKASSVTGGPFLSFVSAFLPKDKNGLIPAIRKFLNTHPKT